METEEEIHNRLSTIQKEFAEKYKYSNCLFKIKVREIIDGYLHKKITEHEVIGWIRKLLDDI